MRVVVSLGVAAIVLACVPLLPYSARFTPDEVEYLSMGYSWASGTGLIDPIQWHFGLAPAAVLPGVASRPPVVPLLFGLGYWAGATTQLLAAAHAVWSAIVAGLITFVAARMMRLPAAAALGLFTGTTTSWIVLAPLLLTEMTAVAVFLAVLASVPAAQRSSLGAVVCAALCIVAYLTRPNFLGLPIAVVVAIAWQLGPRSALRSRPLATYVLTFVGMFLGSRALSVAITGYAPYAAQQVMATQINIEDAMRLSPEVSGTFEFLQRHADEIQVLVAERASALVRTLFREWRYGFVGWIAVPGVAWCLLRRPGSSMRRFCSLSALGFSVTVAITLAAFDDQRYPLLPAVAGGLCGFAFLDDLMRLGGERLAVPRQRAVLAALPLVVALLVVWMVRAPAVSRITDRWPVAPVTNTVAPVPPRMVQLARLCQQFPQDALVATQDPWTLSVLCGNPSMRIPQGILFEPDPGRFVVERSPRFLIVYKATLRHWLRHPDSFELAGESGHLRLLETSAPVGERNTWQGPGPLRCAGFPARECSRSTY